MAESFTRLDYENLQRKLDEEIARRKTAERALNHLGEEHEILEQVVSHLLKFYSVFQYNTIYGKGWDIDACLKYDRAMTIFCKACALEIRKCYDDESESAESNSYPLSAWEAYMRTEI